MLLTHLAAVRRFRFSAHNGQGSATDWQGQGQGSVEVSAAAEEGQLYWEEQGHYTTPHGQRLPCANRYLWQPHPDGILLSHCRQGEPIPLVILTQRSAGCWESVAPHVCGADRYQLTLTYDATGLGALWQIAGPRKNETLRYHYEAD